MLDAPAEQIVDSTPMLDAAATQDTVRLVRHGSRVLIDAVAAADEQAGRVLVDGLEFDYERPSEKPDRQRRAKAERERILTAGGAGRRAGVPRGRADRRAVGR